MFESRISAGATEKLPGWEKPHAKTSAWSYDMEGHAHKCVERYCELANKKGRAIIQVSSPCLDDHNFKKEELDFQEARTGNSCRIIRSVPTDCLEMLVLDTNW